MRVSDYIANRLAQLGIRHVFMVTGGGALFLNYSLGKHPNITPIFNHHEQASAMAAEGYARITNKPSVINVTTGPGGADRSYGIHVAQLAGLPAAVIQRAKEIMAELEKTSGRAVKIDPHAGCETGDAVS